MEKENYRIASVNQMDENAIRKAEAIVKEETGKDYVMIAWEKK
ncbi:MAG: hypothetical protein RSD36_10475 [Terrisporobacter sp.]